MDLIAPWRAAGRTVEVFGRQLFVVEAGQGQGPPLVILHGYPGSSADFASVLPLLARDRRVIVHDHLGFGLSAKPADYSYSLVDQAELALGLWRALGLTEVHLLAHDYGTSIATELLARHVRGLCPVRLRSVTLSNGSVHIELARPLLAQRLLRHGFWGPILARLSSEGYFRRNIAATVAKPLAPDEVGRMWALLIHDDGRARLPAISQYLHERVHLWHRWIGALPLLDLPAHILWGRLDPIARAVIAETLAREIRGAELTWLDDVAHWPTLEAPERWSAEVNRFLARLDAPPTSLT